MANEVKVDLVSHVGRYHSARFGEVEVTHDQWIVMASVNGSPMVHVGYLGKHPNAPLNGLATLRELPEPVRQQIREEAERQAGQPVGRVHVPVAPDPVLLGEYEDEGNNDDED